MKTKLMADQKGSSSSLSSIICVTLNDKKRHYYIKYLHLTQMPHLQKQFLVIY